MNCAFVLQPSKESRYIVFLIFFPLTLAEPFEDHRGKTCLKNPRGWNTHCTVASWPRFLQIKSWSANISSSFIEIREQLFNFPSPESESKSSFSIPSANLLDPFPAVFLVVFPDVDCQLAPLLPPLLNISSLWPKLNPCRILELSLRSATVLGLDTSRPGSWDGCATVHELFSCRDIVPEKYMYVT